MIPFSKIAVKPAWDTHYEMWKVVKSIGGIWQKHGSATLFFHTKKDAEKAARQLVKENPDTYDYRD